MDNFWRIRELNCEPFQTHPIRAKRICRHAQDQYAGMLQPFLNLSRDAVAGLYFPFIKPHLYASVRSLFANLRTGACPSRYDSGIHRKHILPSDFHLVPIHFDQKSSSLVITADQISFPHPRNQQLIHPVFIHVHHFDAQTLPFKPV